MSMSKPTFAKRQREVAKKLKKEEKQRERAAGKAQADAPPAEDSVVSQPQISGA
jgi:hypothetical protein